MRPQLRHWTGDAAIRGMVAQGILSAPAGNQPDPSKLLSVAEIQRFAEQYVSATVLARRFNINGRLLARYLRVIHAAAYCAQGKVREYAVFLLRNVAARLPLAQIKPKAHGADAKMLNQR